VQKIISFLDIWENVEWPRFLDHPVSHNSWILAKWPTQDAITYVWPMQ